MSEENDPARLERDARSGDSEAQEELAITLLTGAELGSEPFARGLRWLETAAGSGRTSALLARGNVHLQHPTLDQAPAIARECYAAAARAGDPTGVERLADLYLFGYGVDRSPEKAFSLYHQLSGYGFPSVLCLCAYLCSEGIGCERDETEAATLILRAVAQGHTLAFVLASLRYGRGLGVPEDPTIAAALMELAAARGFPSAEQRWQSLLEDLDEHSRSRARELAELIKANIQALGHKVRALSVPEDHPDHASRFNRIVAENFQQLNVPELDLDPGVRGCAVRRRPSRGLEQEICCWSPRVIRMQDFASPEECAFLLDAAQPLLRSAAATDPQNVGAAVTRDGEYALFAPYLNTPVTRNLVARLSQFVHLPEKHFEPMSVLRLGIGHEYAPCVDYLDAAQRERNYRRGDLGGQCLVTAFIQLVSPESGGELHYPASDTSVTAASGTALVHYNTTPDGLGDEASVHQGRPVTAGEKWVARIAVRENSLYGELFRTL